MIENQRYIGPYTVLQEIAHSWLGPCYLGRWQDERDEEVCLSPLPSGWGGASASSWLQLVEGLDSLCAVRSPHLTPYLEVLQTHNSEYWLVWSAPAKAEVMPHHLGALLDMQSPGRLNESNALIFLRQIVLGLSSLHDHGTIHGALSPLTIFLDWEQKPPVVCLGLYGLYEFLPQALSRSEAKAALFPYLAPESLALIRESEPLLRVAAQPQQDLYGVGALLWRMLSSAPPSDHVPFASSQNLPWAWPLAQEPHFSPVVYEIFQRTLQIDPTRRTARCEELLDILPVPLVRPTQTQSIIVENHQASGGGSDSSDVSDSSRAAHREVYDTLPYSPFLPPPAHKPTPPSNGRALLDKRTLPYDIDLKALERENLLPTASSRSAPLLASPLTSDVKALSPSQAELVALEELILPDPIPEQWEWEALKQDQKLNERPNSNLVLWLISFGFGLLLWWGFRLACR